MPYLHISTSTSLSEDEKTLLYKEIGELMPLLPNKSSVNTMIHIESGCSMHMGEDPAPCAHMEVRLYKAAPAEAKQAFVAAISALIEKRLHVPQPRFYINLIEYDSWASGGAIKY